MSNKRILTICVDNELMDIVETLQAKRGFSKFIQECLRSQKVIIEAENLENEQNEINDKIDSLLARRAQIKKELETKKVEADNQKSMLQLERELRKLNSMKPDLEHWENLPISKRPKSWHEWNNKRNAVAKSLKECGFDFSRLRKEESYN